MAAVNVSAVVSGVQWQTVAVSAVRLAVLLVAVLLQAYRWVRAALGDSDAERDGFR
jgi:hypothetical protein